MNVYKGLTILSPGRWIIGGKIPMVATRQPCGKRWVGEIARATVSGRTLAEVAAKHAAIVRALD